MLTKNNPILISYFYYSSNISESSV